jgi:hypothetical protein
VCFRCGRLSSVSLVIIGEGPVLKASGWVVELSAPMLSSYQRFRLFCVVLMLFCRMERFSNRCSHCSGVALLRISWKLFSKFRLRIRRICRPVLVGGLWSCLAGVGRSRLSALSSVSPWHSHC